MPRQRTQARYVVCVGNEGYRASLQVRRLYKVLADPEAEKRGLQRVVDESGEDYLFPAELFAAVDLHRSLERR